MDFEVIWRKIHASISPEEEEALNNWLAEHEDHRRLFENAKRFYGRGSEVEIKSVNKEEAWLKVASNMYGRQRSKVLYPKFAFGIAAGVILLLGLSYYFWHAAEKIPVSTPVIAHQVIAPGTDKAILILDDNSSYELSAEQNLSLSAGGSRISSIGNALKYTQDEGAPKPKEIRYNTLKIPRGGQFVLYLEDSTKVWLNSETSLRFPVFFTDETREVELIGEAYFEVQKDTRPFRVISGQQVVEVLGTEFNISSYPESQDIVTTLIEGKVDVHLSENPTIRQTLRPNHQSILVKTESQILRREVDPRAFIAWKEGRFCFKEQSLENIMKTLSRWYDVEIVFETEQAKHIRFTGDIKRHEDFKNIVELIEKTQEVKFTIEGRSIIINDMN